MKKVILLLLMVPITTLPIFGKKPPTIHYTNQQIKEICDSIVLEGKRLYLHEKAAWLATDIGREGGNLIKEEVFNYLVHEEGDTIKACLLNRKLECICEVLFYGEAMEPQIVIWGSRELTEKEKKIFFIKNDLINSIAEKKYRVEVPQGYGLNFVLLPAHNGYKLYILTGTSSPDIVPYGNDYVFFADHGGKITDWRKIHSRLLPFDKKVAVEMGGVRETFHTHRLEEPFISPTYICTFMLYASVHEQKRFSVLSFALRKKIIYELESNSITLEDW